MHQCLIKICKDFETIKGFLGNKTSQDELRIKSLFVQFMECFKSLKEEKLSYPKEFINDVRLYHENFPPLLQKFEDVEMQYLMLSDFYDFVRITKKYKKKG